MGKRLEDYTYGDENMTRIFSESLHELSFKGQSVRTYCTLVVLNIPASQTDIYTNTNANYVFTTYQITTI